MVISHGTHVQHNDKWSCLEWKEHSRTLINTHYQKDISEFIHNCKKHENESGYLCTNFIKTNIENNYKFISGPFVEKIFKILNIQKNKILILMGNIKTSIKPEEHLFYPV